VPKAEVGRNGSYSREFMVRRAQRGSNLVQPVNRYVAKRREAEEIEEDIAQRPVGNVQGNGELVDGREVDRILLDEIFDRLDDFSPANTGTARSDRSLAYWHEKSLARCDQVRLHTPERGWRSEHARFDANGIQNLYEQSPEPGHWAIAGFNDPGPAAIAFRRIVVANVQIQKPKWNHDRAPVVLLLNRDGEVCARVGNQHRGVFHWPSVGTLKSSQGHKDELAALSRRAFRDNPAPFTTVLYVNVADRLRANFPERLPQAGQHKPQVGIDDGGGVGFKFSKREGGHTTFACIATGCARRLIVTFAIRAWRMILPKMDCGPKWRQG
jgi:hypothetical protein